MQSINLYDLLIELRAKLKWIIITVGVFILIGLVVAFTNPKEWKTRIVLIPEATQGKNGLSGALGGIASLAGFSGSESSTGTIRPELYPNIITSTPFLLAMMSQEYYFKSLDQKLSIVDYFSCHEKMPLLSRLSGAGECIEDNEFENVEIEGAILLSKREHNVSRKLGERVNIFVNKESGIITLNVEMQDPQVSAQMAIFAKEYIERYVANYYKQNKLRQLEFIETQVAIKKSEFSKIDSLLAKYKDQNLLLNTEKSRVYESQLQSERDLLFNVFSSLSQQLEESRIEYNKNIPVFTEVEPAVVPINRSKPRKVIILFIFTFLGGFLSVFYFVIQKIRKPSIN